MRSLDLNGYALLIYCGRDRLRSSKRRFVDALRLRAPISARRKTGD
jgi:hypothetical protein